MHLSILSNKYGGHVDSKIKTWGSPNSNVGNTLMDKLALTRVSGVQKNVDLQRMTLVFSSEGRTPKSI